MRRTPLRAKKRVRKVCFPSGRVIEDAAGMARLRSQAYHRSGGRCECGQLNGTRCPRIATWSDGHMHHVVSRNRGGWDVLENVLFLNRDCHRRITGEPRWSWNLRTGEFRQA